MPADQPTAVTTPEKEEWIKSALYEEGEGVVRLRDLLKGDVQYSELDPSHDPHSPQYNGLRRRVSRFILSRIG